MEEQQITYLTDGRAEEHSANKCSRDKKTDDGVAEDMFCTI